MNHIFIIPDSNYITVILDSVTSKFALSDVYKEENGNFVLKSKLYRTTLTIAFADAANWLDAESGGSAYSEAGMRTFFEANSGNFSSGSGGSEPVTTIISLSDLGSNGTNIFPALGAGKYPTNVRLDFEFTYGTTQWVLSGDTLTIQGFGIENFFISSHIFTANQNQLLSVVPTAGITPSSDVLGIYMPKSANTSASVNTDVFIFTESGNDPTTGDGVLEVKVYYDEATF